MRPNHRHYCCHYHQPSESLARFVLFRLLVRLSMRLLNRVETFSKPYEKCLWTILLLFVLVAQSRLFLWTLLVDSSCRLFLPILLTVSSSRHQTATLPCMSQASHPSSMPRSICTDRVLPADRLWRPLERGVLISNERSPFMTCVSFLLWLSGEESVDTDCHIKLYPRTFIVQSALQTLYNLIF